MSARTPTLRGALIRAGLLDSARALTMCQDPELVAVAGPITHDHPLLRDLAQVADPDAALLAFTRLCASANRGQRRILEELLQPASGGEDATPNQTTTRLWAVLGSSPALSEDLIAHPEQLEILPDAGARADPTQTRTQFLASVGAKADSPLPVATLDPPAAVAAMRRHYRRELLRIAAYDLAHPEPTSIVPEVAQGLAELACGALEAGLAIARSQLADHGQHVRLAIMALGKCGARELNYVSDVDVIYVAGAGPQAQDAGLDEADILRQATALASAAAQACSGPGLEPALWQVDAGLRPEGNQGPLVRTLASHLAYYQRWAHTWEFQALLKARFAAGDAELGAEYVATLHPLIWQAVERENFVEDTRAMRRRVEELIPGPEQDRQLKLGKGGLRDIEFTVQLIQMVHGRADETIRRPATLDAISDLSVGGYVSRDDATELADYYRQLRVIEHRLQLHRLTRTHLLPTDADALRRLTKMCRLGESDVAEVWRSIRHRVRDLHEELYYRPILPETARLTAQEAILLPEAAHARLAAIGFADPAGAMRHIDALTEGVGRTALIQRQLLPVMLGWFAQGADPDAGLLAFRRLSDALGRSPWYLKLLRDSGQVAERLASVLSTSQYLTQALTRAPEAIAWLGDSEQLTPRTRESLDHTVAAVLQREAEAKGAATKLRSLRAHELARIAMAEFTGHITTEAAILAVSHVTDAVLSGILKAAERAVLAEGKLAEPPANLVVVAMGRLGGQEVGYASDADVMVGFEPTVTLPDAAGTAHAYAEDTITRWRALLSDPATEPPLEVDLELRPEGRQGPIVRSLESFASYYARWSAPWEAQALLRARPVAGEGAVQQKFLALIDPLRYPAEGLSETQVREIRRIKARVEAERLPRGVDPRRHLKLGPGGVSDVEWLAQLLQLRHAHEHPALRTTGTLEVLDASTGLGLLEETAVVQLRAAWLLATRIRHAVVIFTGRGSGGRSDVLPSDRRVLSGIGQVLGFGAGNGIALEEEWLRVARHARSVFETEFYN